MTIPVPNITGGPAGPATSGSDQYGSVYVGGLNVPAYPFKGTGISLPGGLVNWLLGGSVLALVIALVAGRMRKKRK